MHIVRRVLSKEFRPKQGKQAHKIDEGTTVASVQAPKSIQPDDHTPCPDRGVELHPLGSGLIISIRFKKE